MKIELIYIAGPISSLFFQRRNIARFYQKEEELKQLGLNPFNPCRNEPPNKTWEWYLSRDLQWIVENKPQAIYLMKGWEKSKGARLEREFCLSLGIKVIYETE